MLTKIMRKVEVYFEAKLLLSSLVALAALVVTVRALAAPEASSLIKSDGSSTVFPITEAMAEEFQKLKSGKIKVTVGISGTGGGFKKFCRGETDVQNASRPIQESELKVCQDAKVKFFEIPVGFDATVIVVNPKNTWVNEISVDQLKKMWAPEAQGKVMKWKDVDAKWPDQPLKLYGAGSDSGTFDYFTEAIVGKAKSSRGDYNASEDDNTLVMGVSKDVSALGYLPLAYYEENKSKLKLLGLIGGEKAPKKMQATYPRRENVEKGIYFPLSRPIFIYVNEASYKRAEVTEFVQFYLSQAEKVLPQVKYVALPKALYETSKKNLNAGKLGTVFGGHSEVGMSLSELIKKERKL